jgi:transcriptional regulator with XRE-family HTH domain
LAKKSTAKRFTDAFCDELRAMRERAELSQVEMGRLLGRSQRSISHIEFGTTRLDFPQVMEWCAACRVDFVVFAGRTKRLAERLERERAAELEG